MKSMDCQLSGKLDTDRRRLQICCKIEAVVVLELVRWCILSHKER